ncbi:S-adenosyl-L-methionine-dependent methyltransferase [Catenaria anguillulae PL171]|uniref:S-adenosyl-L-methionine-dependent methyltransferase n=1 Tax=Catenaria anguillulae PL171 TaxID=765915 RepID=A0A1Y2I205_9FUNG|nr:S-adenosyl-L-methionine-dependent methyltransferase [Catenaria anguillulae PL171]
MEDYTTAADILAKLRQKKGSVKSLCLAPKVQNKKKVYALVCQTLKCHSILSDALTRVDVLAHEPSLNNSRDLALVLAHDLLFARRGILCGGWVKPVMMRHRTALRAALVAIAREKGIEIAQGTGHAKVAAAVMAYVEGDQPSVPLPRYVRVNTLKTSVDVVIKQFDSLAQAHALASAGSALEKGHFYQDPHLPSLLVFPPSTDFHLEPMYTHGEIILQDKASSFPAHILSPPEGAHCIDGCAAPGNKTSHLSAILNNSGHITAYDLDSRRLETLKTMTKKAGLTHILLDPSCSGSGIVARLDHLVDTELVAEAEPRPKQGHGKGKSKGAAATEESEEDRLQALAKFQIECVLHAMKFPNVQSITYSTCSIHPQENEHVVAAILAAQPSFTLAPRDRVLPTWTHRGDKGQGLSDEDADKVVRAGPEDGTNGFFVALFERRADASAGAAGVQGAKKRKVDGGETEDTASGEVVAKKKKQKRVHKKLAIKK